MINKILTYLKNLNLLKKIRIILGGDDLRSVFNYKNFDKKSFYRTKLVNIVGKNIKAEIPKKPDIKISNNFIKSLDQLKKELIKKISLKI